MSLTSPNSCEYLSKFGNYFASSHCLLIKILKKSSEELIWLGFKFRRKVVRYGTRLAPTWISFFSLKSCKSLESLVLLRIEFFIEIKIFKQTYNSFVVFIMLDVLKLNVVRKSDRIVILPIWQFRADAKPQKLGYIFCSPLILITLPVLLFLPIYYCSLCPFFVRLIPLMTS